MAREGLADDLPGGDVGSEERGRGGAGVVGAAPRCLAASAAPLWSWIRSDLSSTPGRRSERAQRDRGQSRRAPSHEIGIGRKLNSLQAVRLQAEGAPAPLYGGNRQAASSRHAARTQMVGVREHAVQRAQRCASPRRSARPRWCGAPERGSSRRASRRCSTKPRRQCPGSTWRRPPLACSARPRRRHARSVPAAPRLARAAPLTTSVRRVRQFQVRQLQTRHRSPRSNQRLGVLHPSTSRRYGKLRIRDTTRRPCCRGAGTTVPNGPGDGRSVYVKPARRSPSWNRSRPVTTKGCSSGHARSFSITRAKV